MLCNVMLCNRMWCGEDWFCYPPYCNASNRIESNRIASHYLDPCATLLFPLSHLLLHCLVSTSSSPLSLLSPHPPSITPFLPLPTHLSIPHSSLPFSQDQSTTGGIVYFTTDGKSTPSDKSSHVLCGESILLKAPGRYGTICWGVVWCSVVWCVVRGVV